MASENIGGADRRARRMVDENPPTDPIPVVTDELLTRAESSSPDVSPAPPPREASSPASESWSESINASYVVASPRRGPRASVAAISGGVGALVLVIAAVAWWMLTPDHSQTGTAPDATPASAALSPDEQLLKRLIAIFPPGACRSTASAHTAIATATCTTTDAKSPTSATYAVAPNRSAMTRAFETITRGLDVQLCPGRIQSPGPWRRPASGPNQAAGTVVCGLQAGVPTVAWTTDSDLLISTIHGGNPGPTLDQLYGWWRWNP